MNQTWNPPFFGYKITTNQAWWNYNWAAKPLCIIGCTGQLEIGDLFYKWEEPISPKLPLVIPHSMRKQTLELCHCLPLSGHICQMKTVIKLKQHVLWNGMAMDCKLSTKHHRARLGQYHTGVPIERIQMDISGPLPVTRQTNKYIIMVIDQFTNRLEFYPYHESICRNCSHSINWWLYCKIWVSARTTHWPRQKYGRKFGSSDMPNSSNTEDKNNSISPSF